MAAREYDRLVADAEENDRLREEIRELRSRLTALEHRLAEIGVLPPAGEPARP